MTPAQYITGAIALVNTLYFAPGMWRNDERTLFGGYVIWAASIIACVVAFAGVR